MLRASRVDASQTPSGESSISSKWRTEGFVEVAGVASRTRAAA